MINDMKKLLFLFSVIALAACGDSDDGVNTPPDAPSPRLLTVVVGENPMQDESANAREMTRTAAATTTASLSNFTMNYTDAWDNDFTKTGDTWSTATWPTGDEKDKKINFYAHDGGTFQWNEGTPYVTFTMDENAFVQKDFLVAKHENISYNDNGGKVSLTFDHACAAVQFYVYQEEDASYTVNSIILRGMYNRAEYSYSTGWGEYGYSPEWKKDESKRIYTLTNGDITVTKAKQLLPCGWLFFIPQSKSGIKIDVTYSKAGGTTSNTKALSLPAGTWEAGMQYTVDIRIGKAKTAS